MEKKLKDMGVELNELAIAMCDYIQTGQKTEQLSKFWDNEDSFYQFQAEYHVHRSYAPHGRGDFIAHAFLSICAATAAAFRAVLFTGKQRLQQIQFFHCIFATATAMRHTNPLFPLQTPPFVPL